MQIDQQQIAELERHHGASMVFTITIGDDDFAFRRPDSAEIAYALTAKESGSVKYCEDLALGCVLTAEAPRAGAPARVVDGKNVERNAGISKDERNVLVAEKGRLEALWDAAQELRDTIPGIFAANIGGNPVLARSEIGGGRYEFIVTPRPDVVDYIEPWTFTITARKPDGPQYDKYRTLRVTGGEGDAERYFWGILVDSPNRDEVARLYPFAVIAMGQALASLGVDGRSVRVKKYPKAGPDQKPGNSGGQHSAAETSA